MTNNFEVIAAALSTKKVLLADHIVDTVNARDIWEFVESKQEFTAWIKNRIQKYGFVEGVDYLLDNFIKQLPSGAKTLTEYYCTYEMGKELGMLEANLKGKEIRQYFILCETLAKESQKALSPMEILLQQVQQMVALEKSQEALAIANKKLETMQVSQGNAITSLEHKVSILNKDTEYRSILGYAKTLKIPIPHSIANALGKKATKYCKNNGIHIGTMPHENYGSVHTYPVAVLDIIFNA